MKKSPLALAAGSFGFKTPTSRRVLPSYPTSRPSGVKCHSVLSTIRQGPKNRALIAFRLTHFLSGLFIQKRLPVQIHYFEILKSLLGCLIDISILGHAVIGRGVNVVWKVESSHGPDRHESEQNSGYRGCQYQRQLSR